MLGEYNQSSKKSTIAIIGIFAVIGIIGTAAVIHSRPNEKLLSILTAEEQEFQDYINIYGKSYTTKEYEHRFRAFRDNLAYIRVFNSMKDTVILGINEMADLTQSEFKKIYLPKPLKTSMPESEEFFEGLEAPTSVDWRSKGAVTPVKNQGQCGSCWSFSTTGSIEGAWFIAGHSLTSLSEQQLVDCSSSFGNQGCNGGNVNAAFKYVISNKGITTESNYPYTAKGGSCNSSKASQVAAKISSFTNVAKSNPTALETATAQQPVSVAVDASGSAWQLYKSGTVTSGCGTSLDHAVLIVGYTTTANPPYWIVKNSWGTSWGMSGYIQIAITSGNGVCGINMDPSFPVV